MSTTRLVPLSLLVSLGLGCATPSSHRAPAPTDEGRSSTSAVRQDDVVVTAKLREQVDADTYELQVEIERVGEDGGRELLGSPKMLLTAGQTAEVVTVGDQTISVSAELPAASSLTADALIAVSMQDGNRVVNAPELVLPMPTVLREEDQASVPAAPNRRVSIAFLDEDVRTVVEAIAREAQQNIIMPAAVQGKVTLNVRDVSWHRALELALEPLALSAYAEGDILRIERSPTVSQHCQVWLNFVDEDFNRIVEAIAEQAHINVVIDPMMPSNVTLRAEGVSWLTALETAAEAVGCLVFVSPDGTAVRVTPG
ncbi:MAG: hypothetical protein GY711_28590 [bacterium]|nr:hypothetical protein [bacterium]